MLGALQAICLVFTITKNESLAKLCFQVFTKLLDHSRMEGNLNFYLAELEKLSIFYFASNKLADETTDSNVSEIISNFLDF
jgi:hypothetical protein